MTEKERAKKGLLYDANYEPILATERARCNDLCFEYNHIRPSDTMAREDKMREIAGRIGKNFVIEQPFLCDYGYNLEIGDDVYINYNCVILDTAKVIFGDHVFVAPNCGFYTAGHPLDVEQRNQGLEYAYPITVSSNVWIGGNVAILPGVTIGEGSVIGAGSIVSKDIPAGVIAAGNPCRVIRSITEEDRKKYWNGEDRD